MPFLSNVSITCLSSEGYSGVGIYTRQAVCAPVHAEEGVLGVLCPPGSTTPYRDLPDEECIGGYPSAVQIADLGVDPAVLDAEGRCVCIEFPAFVLFGVYSPANSNGLRDDFRFGFLTALDTRIRNLARMGKNVILSGDLNVSRDLIDTAKAEESMRAEGMTYDEYLSSPNRRVFNQLVHNGRVPGTRDAGREEAILYDLCREFHPDREGMYTHWEQKINARPANFGSRIDFILCSIGIKDWFQEANIQEGLMGSDHCPVFAVTKDQVPVISNPSQTQESEVYTKYVLDLMNPTGMFKDGKRLRDYSLVTDVPCFSGRLLTEFTKRRNIRDMFSRKAKDDGPIWSSISAAVPSIAHVSESHGPLPQSAAPAMADKGTPSIVDTQTIGAAPAASKRAVHMLGPLSPPEKRRAPLISPPRAVKRSKSSLASTSTGAPPLGKGQQSLKGFFLTCAKTSGDATSIEAVPATSPSLVVSEVVASVPGTPASEESSGIPSPWLPTDPLATQEASKEGWTKLFSKKPAPRCEGHAEPCISLTTKKSGVNCGRQFWICPRPIGPSGQKETGTQWRCGTFIWASDWRG